MNTPLNINGLDLPLDALKTLEKREAVNPRTHKGYMRIRASIQAIGPSSRCPFTLRAAPT